MSADPGTPRKGHVQIRDVSVRFGTGGQKTEAASRVSLEVKPGEFVSIIGPSGCGKSTLRVIVASPRGLEPLLPP